MKGNIPISTIIIFGFTSLAVTGLIHEGVANNIPHWEVILVSFTVVFLAVYSIATKP